MSTDFVFFLINQLNIPLNKAFSIFCRNHQLDYIKINIEKTHALTVIVNHISTSMISGPICLILQNGTENSSAGHSRFRSLGFSLTRNRQMQPVHSSNSKSITFPNFLRFRTHTTSFWANSSKYIRHFL